LLLRLEHADRGAIEVNGVDVARLPERALPAYRRNLGAVFQDHHLLANRSVYENVALPLRVGGMRERDAARRVRAALSRVGLLEKEQQFPRALSTGEQQRVGIARAVVNRPKILLADEPTGNLDPELSRDIMTLFQQFRQVGTTVKGSYCVICRGLPMVKKATSPTASVGANPWPSPPRARFAWFRDHTRVAAESFGYLSGRLATSLLVWLLIGIALALPAGLYLLQKNLASLTGEWQGRPGVSQRRRSLLQYRKSGTSPRRRRYRSFRSFQV